MIHKSVFEQFVILQKASKKTKENLLPYATIKSFRKNEHLYLDRDEVTQIYFLMEGTASFYKLGNNQEKKVIFIHKNGDILNEELLDGKMASVNCEFLTSSKVLCFETKKFLTCLENDFLLTKAVMDAMSLRIRRLYHQMKNTVNSMRGDKRMAAKLWKLARDHGRPCSQGTEIDFPLTITYLAELLGSKRETVSRQVKELSNQSLLVIERNRFIIPDCDELLKYFSLS